MAVFTSVSRETLVKFLSAFDLGELVHFEGIPSGIENTNYFVDTSAGRYVLTLFEKLSADQLPFYLELMRHLARKGVACPMPMASRDGKILHECQSRPASLATRLAGQWPARPDAVHCQILGEAIAKAHLAVSDYGGTQPNLRGLSWWKKVVPELLGRVAPDQAELLSDELKIQSDFAQTPLYRSLKTGAVHADLFRDNVLFDESARTPVLGGFIDFYFAGIDTFVFDLCVAINDWCIDLSPQDSGALDPSRLSALLAGYERIRPLAENEKAAVPTLLRAAAYRFWVSRLYDWHLPRSAQMLTPKDPGHFERLLKARRQSPLPNIQ